MKENFSFEMMTNPKKFFMDMLKNLVIFIIKVIVAGLIFYMIMKKVGLTDDHSIKNYLLYLMIGSIVMYCVSIVSMMLECYSSGTPFEKMNFMKFAKSSFFVPLFVLIHIIILIICGFLKVAPEIGILIYMLSWTSFGIVIGTGIAYNLTYAGVKHFVQC